MDIGSECLSEDSMFDILTWLPAKFILSIARYGCNTWAAMIRSSVFVKTHLLRAKPGIFLQSTRSPYGARFLEIKENGEFEVSDLNPQYPGRFLNSCDGLMLLFDYATRALHVANPVTMQLFEVPYLLQSRLRYPACAIVRLPRTGEFKLFASVVINESGVSHSHWHVLRLGQDNSWTEIAVEPGDFGFRCSPIFNGGSDLYWITKHRVIVLDVETETFRVFPLSQEHRRETSRVSLIPQQHRLHPQYLKMGNCLTSIISLEQGFQIHIFDSDSGNWTLYHQMGDFVYPRGSYEVHSEFFVGWMDNELIIRAIIGTSSTTLIFMYNVQTGTLRQIDGFEVGGSYDVCIHTNSLVSWESP